MFTAYFRLPETRFGCNIITCGLYEHDNLLSEFAALISALKPTYAYITHVKGLYAWDYRPGDCPTCFSFKTYGKHSDNCWARGR